MVRVDVLEVSVSSLSTFTWSSDVILSLPLNHVISGRGKPSTLTGTLTAWPSVVLIVGSGLSLMVIGTENKFIKHE